MGRITIRDVARKAGVAVSTASIALAGSARVRTETRDRVEKAAKALGYRRFTAAAALSSLAHRHPETVGHQPLALLSGFGGDWQDEPERRSVIKAARDRAIELGYEPMIYSFVNEPNQRSLSRILWSRGVAGILVGSVNHLTATDLMSGHFDWDRFPSVACARYQAPWRSHMVYSEHFESARNLTALLLAAGCRRIAYCVGTHKPPNMDDEERLGGTRAALDLFPKAASLHVFRGTIGQYEEKIRWVRRVRPDAVIGFSAWDYERLLEARFRIPDDFRFACLVLDPTEDPGIAGCVEPFKKVGAEAINLLDRELRFRSPPVPEHPLKVVLTPTFRNGESLGAVPPVDPSRL